MYVRYDGMPNKMFRDDSSDRVDYKENLKFARAYVLAQPYIGMFPLAEALKKGMLFPNLYVPYKIKSKE